MKNNFISDVINIRYFHLLGKTPQNLYKNENKEFSNKNLGTIHLSIVFPMTCVFVNVLAIWCTEFSRRAKRYHRNTRE